MADNDCGGPAEVKRLSTRPYLHAQTGEPLDVAQAGQVLDATPPNGVVVGQDTNDPKA